MIRAGDVLVVIDPADYELRVAELEAQLDQLEARAAELETRQQNAEAALEIETRALELDEREVERQRELLATEAGSQAALEQQQRNHLRQLQRVQELRNTLALLPAESRRLDAERAATEARLGGARLDLERTSVRAPFACRIHDVRVERSQFVRSGDPLCEAYDIASAEVRTQVPLARLRHLLGAQRGTPIDFEQLASRDWLASLGMTAEVRLRAGGDFTPRWSAELARLGSTLDPQTRTMEVVVRVDDPYGRARLGERPPLVPQMYCEVELRGTPREAAILVPRSAVHQGVVHLVVDGALRHRQVEVGMTLGDFLVVDDGLQGGERLIVSDVVPAFPGLRVAAEDDPAITAAIAAAAAGEPEAR